MHINIQHTIHTNNQRERGREKGDSRQGLVGDDRRRQKQKPWRGSGCRGASRSSPEWCLELAVRRRVRGLAMVGRSYLGASCNGILALGMGGCGAVVEEKVGEK